MTPWEHFTTLRDEHGTIVLEEVDEDTATATFRVHARRSVTARLVAGEVRFEGDPPPALRAALTAPPGEVAAAASPPRVPASPAPSPRAPAPVASPPRVPASPAPPPPAPAPVASPPREPASPAPPPRAPAPVASSPGEPGSHRGAWVAAGVACGIAAIAAWRRR
ncbi:MAG TPA: hypothetical protein VNS09_19880 [Solirubrobacter sp.]|nr:hypothetical protein [Solirubrobacter sp.]